MITADGSYGARLARDGESWFPERWTLDGPEPYAVPLPGNQPEEPGTEVLPMTDGRVLIHRVADGRHVFSLLYPTGPATGELPLGTVECPDRGTRLRLLPPAPGGERAYALAVGPHSTAVWLVAGGAFGPEHLAEIPGRCSGGVWLDGTERLLALDREAAGRTKAVVVDLERGGEVSPLLQIAEESNDRLLLADPDSGLLLIRSDAPSPGHDRLGWGVLGSTLPVRFPEALRLADCAVTPFAIQPGQVLTPESCAVALRIDGAGGTWVGVWRPADRRVHHLPAPEGWLAGAGLWTREGVLHLPYATGTVACGVARAPAPARTPGRAGTAVAATPVPAPDATWGSPSTGPTPAPGSHEPAAPRPVPLQQAPLHGRPRPARHHPTPTPTPVERTGTVTGASTTAPPAAAQPVTVTPTGQGPAGASSPASAGGPSVTAPRPAGRPAKWVPVEGSPEKATPVTRVRQVTPVPQTAPPPAAPVSEQAPARNPAPPPTDVPLTGRPAPEPSPAVQPPSSTPEPEPVVWIRVGGPVEAGSVRGV